MTIDFYIYLIKVRKLSGQTMTKTIINNERSTFKTVRKFMKQCEQMSTFDEFTLEVKKQKMSQEQVLDIMNENKNQSTQ